MGPQLPYFFKWSRGEGAIVRESRPSSVRLLSKVLPYPGLNAITGRRKEGKERERYGSGCVSIFSVSFTFVFLMVPLFLAHPLVPRPYTYTRVHTCTYIHTGRSFSFLALPLCLRMFSSEGIYQGSHRKAPRFIRTPGMRPPPE